MVHYLNDKTPVNPWWTSQLAVRGGNRGSSRGGSGNGSRGGRDGRGGVVLVAV